jgi:hypothetical protein
VIKELCSLLIMRAFDEANEIFCILSGVEVVGEVKVEGNLHALKTKTRTSFSLNLIEFHRKSSTTRATRDRQELNCEERSV